MSDRMSDEAEMWAQIAADHQRRALAKYEQSRLSPVAAVAAEKPAQPCVRAFTLRWSLGLLSGHLTLELRWGAPDATP